MKYIPTERDDNKSCMNKKCPFWIDRDDLSCFDIMHQRYLHNCKGYTTGQYQEQIKHFRENLNAEIDDIIEQEDTLSSLKESIKNCIPKVNLLADIENEDLLEETKTEQKPAGG